MINVKILKSILIILLAQAILLGQNNSSGYPLFLKSETSYNFDYYDSLDIETTLYSYSNGDTVLQVGDFYDYFSDVINYNDNTFFIKTPLIMTLLSRYHLLKYLLKQYFFSGSALKA